MNTIVITADIESGFASLKMTRFHSIAVQFPHAWHHSKRRRRCVGFKDSTCMGSRDPKCPPTRNLRMVEDTGAPSEGATCAWMAADEAVSCTCAFRTMWRCSRRLVCRGCPEPGLCVNDISQHNKSSLFDEVLA
ncbi:uncharacterized protein TNCV_3188731 [Trichonephila clavipes]|nr:uncharacterized protein TNCV_3188731 [Trichonephila clavipes]